MKLSLVSFKSSSAIFLFSKSLAFFTLLAFILTKAPASPKPMAATFPVLSVITPPITHAKLAAAYLVLYSHHASSNLSAIFQKDLTVFSHWISSFPSSLQTLPNLSYTANSHRQGGYLFFLGYRLPLLLFLPTKQEVEIFKYFTVAH